ncbi:unnamed protein product [Orchesella dallaii]|uniref:Uncharacterized protein n=1 Tax=Orchesella dallaii TaxID=48710 RepID=A0ABP1QVT1_9HEXA
MIFSVFPESYKKTSGGDAGGKGGAGAGKEGAGGNDGVNDCASGGAEEEIKNEDDEEEAKDDDDDGKLYIHEGPNIKDAQIEPPRKNVKEILSGIDNSSEKRMQKLMRKKKIGPLSNLSYAERIRRKQYELEVQRLARPACPLSRKPPIKWKLNNSAFRLCFPLKLHNLRIPSSKLPAGKSKICCLTGIHLHHSNINFQKWRNQTIAMQVGKISKKWKIPDHYPCMSRKDCRIVRLGLGPIVKPIPIRDSISEKNGECLFGSGLRCAYCFEIISPRIRLIHLARCSMLPEGSIARAIETSHSVNTKKVGSTEGAFELSYIPVPGYSEFTWYKPLDPIHPCPMCGIRIIWNKQCFQMHLDRVCQGLSNKNCAVKNEYKYFESFVGLGGRCDKMRMDMFDVSRYVTSSDSALSQFQVKIQAPVHPISVLASKPSLDPTSIAPVSPPKKRGRPPKVKLS